MKLTKLMDKIKLTTKVNLTHTLVRIFQKAKRVGKLCLRQGGPTKTHTPSPMSAEPNNGEDEDFNTMISDLEDEFHRDRFKLSSFSILLMLA